MDMMSELFAAWFGIVLGKKLEESLSKDHLEDPVYKKNLQRLIDRNREFEEERNK
jgi:hypothetical protein